MDAKLPHHLCCLLKDLYPLRCRLSLARGDTAAASHRFRAAVEDAQYDLKVRAASVFAQAALHQADSCRSCDEASRLMLAEACKALDALLASFLIAGDSQVLLDFAI